MFSWKWCLRLTCSSRVEPGLHRFKLARCGQHLLICLARACSVSGSGRTRGICVNQKGRRIHGCWADDFGLMMVYFAGRVLQLNSHGCICACTRLDQRQEEKEATANEAAAAKPLVHGKYSRPLQEQSTCQTPDDAWALRGACESSSSSAICRACAVGMMMWREAERIASEGQRRRLDMLTLQKWKEPLRTRAPIG